MRKFLSLVMMAMLAVGAWAADETVVFSEQGYANQEEVTSYSGTDFTVTFDKGTNSNTPKYFNTGAAIRVYGGGYFTVSSSTKTIAKIEVGFGSGDGTNAITTDVETYSNGTWTGSATSVKFTVGGTSGHRRIASIAVTYAAGDTPVQTVTPPTFSPAAGEVEAGTAVTISAPDAEMIIYTTDGTTPSYANSVGEIYDEPIVVNEAMTIKAIAVDASENESAVATAAYTIKPQAVTVATVAEFNALADNTVFTFTGSLVATGQTGKYLYAEDSDGILIYGNIGQTYSDLAVIPGGWTGKKTTYAGAPEAADPAGFAAATDHADLAPEEMTPAQVTVDNAFRYAVIRGATIDNGNLVVGNESVALYNSRFNVDVPTDGGVYDVIGITGFFNNPQFMPLEFVAQATEVAAPVITGETPFIGSTTVTIECETEDATIYYTIDGTEPTNQSTEYTAPFEITETTTVKAIAFNEAEDCSPIVSKEFVKTLTVATAAEYLALEDGTEFVFTGNLVVTGQAGQRLYAQDDTGGVLIYGNAGQTYKFGDVIPAGFSAKKANYNGTIEMTNMSGMQAATETAELVAKEIAIADYEANQNIYVVVKNATLDGTTLVVGEETLATYNRFGVDYPTDGKAYDVYGVSTIYNNAPQLHPISFVEYQEPVVESFISYTAQQENGTVAVVLEDGTPVESLVTKVAEGEKFTVTATAATGYVVTGIEVKAGEIVITPSDEPYEGEFSAPRAEGSTEMTQTYTMPAEDVAITVTFEVKTGIDSISMENVKSVRFYNAAGVESATPFNGVNIVVREMNDGSKSVIKVVK
ncbi:MAG: chitobiase/beta-hexosaminidase C-terminal domain-containing protein [Muribaculaceae bacterium]|nr:chitobiase/beta-hexosaminidase C-terminal domain-containing protein [Muribaculaceae bacterium]